MKQAVIADEMRYLGVGQEQQTSYFFVASNRGIISWPFIAAVTTSRPGSRLTLASAATFSLVSVPTDAHPAENSGHSSGTTQNRPDPLATAAGGA